MYSRKLVSQLVIIFLLIAQFLLSAPTLANDQTHQEIILQADRTEAGYNASNKLMRAPRFNQYLNSLMNRLIEKEPEAKKLFRIHSLYNALPFIYCLDNGAIYVSTGLIARLQNESQFAGLLAPEMAAVFNQNAEVKKDTTAARHAPNRDIPELLAVVFTGGLAALPISSNEKKFRNALDQKLQLEADHLAMQWITQAGFDPNQATAATQRLTSTLSAEKRFGDTNYSNQKKLHYRTQQLAEAAANVGVFTMQTTDEKEFKYFVKLINIDLARMEKGSVNLERFFTILNRIEEEIGKDGETQFLRAEHLKEIANSDAQLSEATKAYEEATSLQNTPPETYRELGLLYRRLNDKNNAQKNLQLYLTKQPSAADAPIMKMYLETL